MLVYKKHANSKKIGNLKFYLEAITLYLRGEERKKKMELEEISMSLIAYAGDARTLAYQALAQAKQGNFLEAHKLMAQSEEKSVLAHKVQTDLLFAEANGEAIEVNILLIHAQDHMMTGMLAQELIKELIEMYESR